MLDLLSRINKIEFHSISKGSGDTKAKGQGVVEVIKEDSDSIVFNESLEINFGNTKKFKSSNVYRWSKITDNQLSLEHLRRGKANPLFLVNLYKRSKKEWNSIEPHVCSKDLYSASIKIIDENSFDLTWEINGPNKDELNICSYSLAQSR